jgi:prepilin-type N-terminal cleavage/methylation domain-containing protein
VIVMRRMNRKGFTLVEIMIVVAIIGLLAAIAIPNFVRARETALKNACIANMKQIQGAIQVWAIDTGAASNATAGTGDLVLNYIKAWPKCGTATYAVPTVDGTPTCPSGTTGHTL